MEPKTIYGIVAVGLNILAFWPYIVDTVRGKTKPHRYSWFIWTLITSIVFVGQVIGRAGPGAWATGCTTAIDLVIFLLSLGRGTADITRSDKLCLASALAAAVLWAISDSLALSITLVTLIDTLAFLPTIRKILKSPGEETFITYPLSSMRCLLSLLAIAHYSVVTCIYPFAMLTMYVLITAILVVKRPGYMRLRGVAYYMNRRHEEDLEPETVQVD